MWAVWLAGFAWAGSETPPLPGFRPAPLWGVHEVAVGTGGWQLPPRVNGYDGWPRFNLHASYTLGFGRRLRSRVGVLTAVQVVPGALRAQEVFRVEPRLLHRIGDDDFSIDAGLGVSFEAGWADVPVGPVVFLEPRFWLGEAHRTFVGLEGRLAPLFLGTDYTINCFGNCPSGRVENPGGTGVLVRVGRVLDARRE